MNHLLGLPLPRVLAMLDSDPVIVETAPPLAPKNRTPVWGEARVLRALEKDGHVELLVARELLAEDSPPSSPSPPL